MKNPEMKATRVEGPGVCMEVSKLRDTALDWAVALANGQEEFWTTDNYSTNWALGGPIIEREELSSLKCYGKDDWECNNGDIFCEGPTPLIAAMRCYVASKLGADIEVPSELIGE